MPSDYVISAFLSVDYFEIRAIPLCKEGEGQEQVQQS